MRRFYKFASIRQHIGNDTEYLGATAPDVDYFPAQNSTPFAFGENHPAGGKLQGRTELNLTSVVAADSFL
jgi:hypothetical protein